MFYTYKTMYYMDMDGIHICVKKESLFCSVLALPEIVHRMCMLKHQQLICVDPFF